MSATSASPPSPIAPTAVTVSPPVDPLVGASGARVRVFYLDALLCPKCGGRRKVLAFLTDPDVVRKILSYLGLETAPPALAPARLGASELRLWEWEAGRREWDEGDVVWRERGDGGAGDKERGPP
jgi:hypothetical protein